MEVKINIGEILKDKPIYTKLWSPLYGDVFYKRIVSNDGVRVLCKGFDGSLVTDEKSFWKNGKFTLGGEICLFPSNEMRSWEKFAWKKGDMLVSNDGKIEVLFITWVNNSYTKFVGLHCLITNDNEEVEYDDGTTIFNTNDFKGIEVEDAAQTYINTIEERLGGKLNPETLEIEKQPEFKVMDWCLMRDFGEKWKLCQFGFVEETPATDNAPYNAIGGNWFNECIPYNEDTKHLLGTTDEWKGGEGERMVKVSD